MLRSFRSCGFKGEVEVCHWDLGEDKGEFIRQLAPITVNVVVRKLPFEGRAAVWKEEVYFAIHANMKVGKSEERC
jgi:hypothetical protein